MEFCYETDRLAIRLPQRPRSKGFNDAIEQVKKNVSKLTPKKYTKKQIKLSKFIEKRLSDWGFQHYVRHCYTPKYGEDSYAIEDWSNEDVADLLVEDILTAPEIGEQE